jgi:hypothetical protein
MFVRVGRTATVLHSGQARQNNLDKFFLEILRHREVKEDGSLFGRPFVVDHNRFGGCFFVERLFIVDLKWLACFFLVRPVILVDLTAFLAFVVVATLDRMFGVIGFGTLGRTLDYFRDRRLRLEPLPFA